MNEQILAATRRRLLRGIRLKWDAKTGWLDQNDAQPVEGPYLLWGLEEGLQRWQNQIAEDIVDKPLPDIDKLNAAIPKSEWENDLNGNPKPPWSHQYVFYLLDPNSGQIYTYMNSTVGAKILWENLEERWTILRQLRGDVYPVVNLSSHQFKSRRWGIVFRADLVVTDWRKIGSGPAGMLTGPTSSPLQLPPTSDVVPAPTETAPPASAAPAQPQPTQPQPSQPSSPPSSPSPSPSPPPPPKPAAKKQAEQAEGLAFLEKVKPPTVGEEIDDEIPW
jgi:hypothetical protein